MTQAFVLRILYTPNRPIGYASKFSVCFGLQNREGSTLTNYGTKNKIEGLTGFLGGKIPFLLSILQALRDLYIYVHGY